jgi:hypothetical protein
MISGQLDPPCDDWLASPGVDQPARGIAPLRDERRWAEALRAWLQGRSDVLTGSSVLGGRGRSR